MILNSSNEFRKSLGKIISKKRGKGVVHWRAGANQPAQPAKPAQACPRRVHLPPRALGHGRAARARPCQANSAAWTSCAARRRHDLPLRCGQRHLLRHSRLHPVRALSPSLSLSHLRSARTAPPPAIGPPRAPFALFPALRRLPAPPSTSPSSAFVFTCSDVTSSRR